jgi:hypothetical protein
MTPHKICKLHRKGDPMSTAEYFHAATRDLHKSLYDAVKDLTAEQLHFRPIGKGNHIAFLFWHYVRTEDAVINGMFQKKPMIWNAEGWDKKFGLDPRAQGTGMTEDQAASLRITDLNAFLQYTQKVFQATESFIAEMKPETWSEVRDLPMLGKRNGYQLVGGIVLTHGAEHLGEIWYIKGLQGMKGSPH